MLKHLFQMIIGIILFLLFCYIVVEDFADSCDELGGTVTLSLKEMNLFCVKGEVVEKYKLINILI